MEEPRAPRADLNELIVFTRVVQAGGFTAAAARLGMPKSTVSRKVSELEARVGARLLQRTTRKLGLTDVGRAYYEHTARIVAELEEAERAITELQSTPRGKLRVTVPLTFGMLGPVMAELLARCPELQVELLCTDRRVDLVEERFDLAIRAGPLADSTLVGRKLGMLRRLLVAAPAYLQRREMPRAPADLRKHECIVFGASAEGNAWKLGNGTRTVEVAAPTRLVVNDYGMLREVARSGVGVALLPDYLCAEDLKAGRLRRVLEGWTAPEVPIHAVYPSARHLSPKVIALLELLRERLQLNAVP
ncbi:LysR family transcriptional regulator [Myxococcaceae bacterium GXIMD 01537]